MGAEATLYIFLLSEACQAADGEENGSNNKHQSGKKAGLSSSTKCQNFSLLLNLSAGDFNGTYSQVNMYRVAARQPIPAVSMWHVLRPDRRMSGYRDLLEVRETFVSLGPG